MAENKNPLKDKLNDDELDLSISNFADRDVPVKDIALLKRATKLDLSNNKLVGLPKSFATLTHLVKLDLSCNCITELPSNFGELHRLKHLDLYNNKLSHLPLSFHQLTSLRWLDLKNNQLSAQLAEAAGECLNPRECEQCARRVVQFMGRVKEHYDQERIRRQQHEKELMEAKQAAEEAERERLRLEKKAKKEKRKQELRDQKKVENIHPHHPAEGLMKSSSPLKSQDAKTQKDVKAGGWSLLAKLNLALLVTALALAGGAVYLHAEGDVSRSGLSRAADNLAASLSTVAAATQRQGRRAFDVTLVVFKRASELGTSAGDLVVGRALALWEWASGHAAALDRHLTDNYAEQWGAAKAAVGGAWSAAGRLGRSAGESALELAAYAARRGWELAEAGGAAARWRRRRACAGTAAPPCWRRPPSPAAPPATSGRPCSARRPATRPPPGS